MSANAYSFLPWLRTGLSTHLSSDPGTAQRASVAVPLRLNADASARNGSFKDITPSVRLYGPGDVVGVDARAISRVEPRDGITNAEPNYLVHVEFVEEDFVWRYSPAPADATTARLAPWLALVVLTTDGEFTAAPADGPLPAITVTAPDTTLPPADQLGAWAHVQVNGALVDPVATGSSNGLLAALERVLATDADSACSRLICPRRLSPDTAYTAFLVPAFETGRLAGLGFDPALAPSALHSAWGPAYPGQPVAGRLPYYHRWSFGTGSTGDFEFLVRQLQPRPPDPRVGVRPFDVHNSPGLDLPGLTERGGVLSMGGALKVPDPSDGTVAPEENWDNWHDQDDRYPHDFQRRLAAVINLADDYQRTAPAQAHAALAALAGAEPAHSSDPLVTPPLYGRWPALTTRLLTDEQGHEIGAPGNRNWVHRLNLDPRFRIAANLGAQVVQARQEELMAAAWAQVGDVLAANHRIRAAQLAREVGHVLQEKHLDPTPVPAAPGLRGRAVDPAVRSGRSLRLTAPAHARLTTARTGVRGLIATGDDPSERIAVGFQVAASQIAGAPLSPAMRRITRPGSRLMRSLDFPEGPGGDLLLSRMDAASGAVVAARLKRTPPAVVTAEQLDALLHPDPAADPVDSLPRSPDFVLRDLTDATTPHPGGADSAEALRFKAALHELYAARATAVAVSRPDVRAPLEVEAATQAVLGDLSADATVPKSLLESVDLPERLRPFAEEFIEAMAYPVIDLPMYQSLLARSADAFVPNLGLVPANSITLLANNRQFIESYLVGLNHEMARELLWREYPTDQRGTPFRQFWDPRAMLPAPPETPAERTERGYDIRPIHTWAPTAQLGQNDNRQALGVPQKDDLVLVIRGELLRKYPNAAIYAQRADWAPGDDGHTLERVLSEPATDVLPSADQIRLPLYEATVEPDVHLLGFDLDADEARGHRPDDPGWFFVLKERPGDPRFGADDGPAGRVEVWNDLTWSQINPDGAAFLRLDPEITVGLQAFDGSEDDPEKEQQRAEDENLPLWSADLSSADLAYVLFQVPVLVAVHAQEMLPR